MLLISFFIKFKIIKLLKIYNIYTPTLHYNLESYFVIDNG